MRTIRVAAPLAFLLVGCAAGSRGRDITFQAEPDAHGIQQVAIDMHSYHFEPNHVVVKAGSPVELVVRNRAFPVPHNLTIEDPALRVSVGSLIGTAHARFTPLKPGTYPFHCHVDGHAGKGMKGTLVVEP